MISYELAKELKDAGFPQGKGQWLYDGHQMPFLRAYKGNFVGTEIDAPTLEELIGACGDIANAGFELRTGDYGQKKWKAQTFGNFKQACTGQTPTEAVGRLWLALHGNSGGTPTI